MKHLISCILIYIVFSSSAFSQKFQFSVGKNLTNYHLINTAGTNIDYLHPGSGQTVRAIISQQFLDTLKLQTNSPERALTFSKRKNLSKILSHLHYSSGLYLSDFNATGDIQQIALRYETNYLGAELGLGVHFRFFKRFELSFNGNVSASKMLDGQQQIGSNFYSLVNNPHFDGIKILKGYQLALTSKISSQTEFFVTLLNQSSLINSESSTGTFGLSNQNISMGIALHFK